MLDFFVEYQNWGVNALTVSFLLSVGITLVVGWGLIQQQRTIWQSKNAAAVSVPWMVYNAVLQLVVLTYGIATQSAALLLNGLLALLYVPILVGLWKFKGFTRSERIWAVAFLVGLGAMMPLPYKEWFFFAFALGGLLSAATQPMEMWRKKSASGLNIRLVSTFIFGTVVWLSYGLAVQDWVIIIVNAAAFLIFGLTILLWRKFKTT